MRPHPSAPTTLVTPRLRLRPPRPDDAAVHHALHSDPATYRHAPWALVDDPVRNRAGLQAWIDGWARDGVGYWVVEEPTGGVVGFAGVRPADGALNLYYRLTPAVHGRGYGREAARAVVAWAAEWLPGERVEAVVHPQNEASVRTARAAGLSRVGTRDVAGDPEGTGPSEVLVAPRVARETPADGLVDDMLDLWCAVNAAGGSVGFLRDSPRSAVAEVLDRELARTGDDAPLVTLRDAADGRLLGFCWWVRDPFVLFAHSVVLKRLMVDPSEQGRNLGALLLSGAHAVARELPDVDLLRLDYRSGSGLGAFYARHGWTETGRVPRLIRLAPDDHRDSVQMARLPLGGELRPDGRL